MGKVVNMTFTEKRCPTCGHLFYPDFGWQIDCFQCVPRQEQIKGRFIDEEWYPK